MTISVNLQAIDTFHPMPFFALRVAAVMDWKEVGGRPISNGVEWIGRLCICCASHSKSDTSS